MKKVFSTLVIAAAISSPAFAGKGHEHGEGKGPPTDGMTMGMMCQDMMQRMGMMEKRMGMMQMMMEHMMDHESESKKALTHKHKK